MERKHREQMTQEEIDFVEYLLWALSGWQIESALVHATKRGRKRFNREDVLEAIQTGRVIEVNSLGRVLIRAKSGLCVVVSPQSRIAITIWKCDPKDNHKKLDRRLYTWRVNVIEYLTSLRSTR